MLPSLLTKDIKTGLKQFLTAGFEPSDAFMQGLMSRFVEDESAWLKGPYVQVGLPFVQGQKGKQFFSTFETQFPVMQGYERDTWYDINGRITFTNSKGLTGVGLPRKGGRNTPRVRIQTPDGNPREGNFGWEDLYKDGKWMVPDGTVVTEEVMDDTLPGGPRKIERRYVAPFARADREEDYRIAWAFFESSREG